MLEKISCFTVFRGGWREGHIQGGMERGAYSVVDGERGIFSGGWREGHIQEEQTYWSFASHCSEFLYYLDQSGKQHTGCRCASG